MVYPLSSLLCFATIALAAATAIDRSFEGHNALPGLLDRKQTVFGQASYVPTSVCEGTIIEEGEQFGAKYSVYYSTAQGGLACMMLENVSGSALRMVAAVYTVDSNNFASDGKGTIFPAHGYAGPIRLEHIDRKCWTWALVVDGDKDKTFGYRYCRGKVKKPPEISMDANPDDY
jgi:hypothetical protein